VAGKYKTPSAKHTQPIYDWGILSHPDEVGLAYACIVQSRTESDAAEAALAFFRTKGAFDVIVHMAFCFGVHGAFRTVTDERHAGMFYTQCETAAAVWAKTIPSRTVIPEEVD